MVTINISNTLLLVNTAPLELNSPESFVIEESGGVSFDSLSNTDNLTDAICKLLDECKKQAAIIDPYAAASTNGSMDGNHKTINYLDEPSLFKRVELIDELFSQFHDAYFIALKAMYDSALLYEQARARLIAIPYCKVPLLQP